MVETLVHEVLTFQDDKKSQFSWPLTKLPQQQQNFLEKVLYVPLEWSAIVGTM